MKEIPTTAAARTAESRPSGRPTIKRRQNTGTSEKSLQKRSPHDAGFYRVRKRHAHNKSDGSMIHKPLPEYLILFFYFIYVQILPKRLINHLFQFHDPTAVILAKSFVESNQSPVELCSFVNCIGVLQNIDICLPQR